MIGHIRCDTNFIIIIESVWYGIVRTGRESDWASVKLAYHLPSSFEISSFCVSPTLPSAIAKTLSRLSASLK